MPKPDITPIAPGNPHPTGPPPPPPVPADRPKPKPKPIPPNFDEEVEDLREGRF